MVSFFSSPIKKICTEGSYKHCSHFGIRNGEYSLAFKQHFIAMAAFHCNCRTEIFSEVEFIVKTAWQRLVVPYHFPFGAYRKEPGQVSL